MKKTTLLLKLGLILSLAPNMYAVLSIGHPEPNTTTTGSVLSSSGTALTTGGESIGYFTGTAPTLSQWATLNAEGPSQAYLDLINPTGTYKFVDVRAATLGGTQNASFDWNFGQLTSPNTFDISGTVSGISGGTGTATSSVLTQGTQLYLLAFNAGTFANSFSGATQWAVAAATDWVAPTNTNGSKNLLLNTVDTAAELIIGTDNGNNINLAAPVSVPEPSRFLLTMLGAGLAIFRRRR